jgi:hypothetical protein
MALQVGGCLALQFGSSIWLLFGSSMELPFGSQSNVSSARGITDHTQAVLSIMWSGGADVTQTDATMREC